jgi:hypothetical protein
LGKDRWLNLRVRAAAKKLIDYREFDRRDSVHRIREALLLDELERQELAEANTARRATVSAGYIAAAALHNSEHIHINQRELVELTNRYLEQTIPWLMVNVGNPAAVPVNEAVEAKQQWERIFGKMDSAKVREALGNLTERLEKSPKLGDPLPPGANFIRSAGGDTK